MSAPAIHTHVLNWDRDQPYQLGRHVEHHLKSKGHPAAVAAKLVTKLWSTSAPVLNQGNLGACTGNAITDAINTDYWGPTRSKVHGAGYLAEPDAIGFYELATTLDNIPGQYPPTDTGSTGIAVAKAAKQKGYVSTYAHAFGLNHMIGALQLRPVICGTVWTNGMFTPDANGFISPQDGDVAGGHEYLCLGVDMENEFLTFLNSWSDTWGQKGRFKITFADFDELLEAKGDVVVPVPVVVPAPVAA